MNTFVITECRGKTLCGFWEGNHPLSIYMTEPGEEILDSVYVGRISHVVPGIHAAFTDIGTGEDTFLSLSETILRPDGSVIDKPRPGDEVLVQAVREKGKNKPAQVSCRLTLTGHLAVFTPYNHTVGVSSKIPDKAWREKQKENFLTFARENGGLILRTESYQAEEEARRELEALFLQYKSLLAEAPFRKAPSCLKQGDSAWKRALLGAEGSDSDRIVTDDAEVYEELKRFLQAERPGLLDRCSFYEGKPSLRTVYSIEAELDRALGRKVYLPGGGYLFIDRTEALSVIDVNSGSMTGKKGQSEQETYRKVNREAIREACRQIRLRNLSGIILIDFVNLLSDEDQKELFSLLSSECAKDPTPTKAVDFTRLGLAEITRKKIRKPLSEQGVSKTAENGQ